MRELPAVKGYIPKPPSPIKVHPDEDHEEFLANARRIQRMMYADYLDQQLEELIAETQPSLPLITPTPLVAQVQTPSDNEVQATPPSDGTETTVTPLQFPTHPRPPPGPRPPTAARKTRARSNSLAKRRINGGVDPLAPPPRPGLISMEGPPGRMATRLGGNQRLPHPPQPRQGGMDGLPRPPPTMRGGNHDAPRAPQPILGGIHRVPLQPPSLPGRNLGVGLPRQTPSMRGGNHLEPIPPSSNRGGNHRVPAHQPQPRQAGNRLEPLPPSSHGGNRGDNSRKFMKKSNAKNTETTKPSEEETVNQTGEMKPHPPARPHSFRVLHKRTQLTEGWDIILRTTREEVLEVINPKQTEVVEANDPDQSQENQSATEQTLNHESSPGVTFRAPSCTSSSDQEEIPEEISAQRYSRSRFV
ncbi:proline-rich protein 2-like [Lytechinus variegatus]|uniref:proline-rich protein 2-like n=1 Tax=Lytechinus variegatus TaxID=7654 RepID=UPI001BB1A06F|nr:proline-rich protein 2-like [Lytechinus variegatus]